MVEALTASVVFNLFLLYRYLVLHRKFYVMAMLLFRISRGEASIKFDDATGLKIKTTP
jgi:hypothetical protein